MMIDTSGAHRPGLLDGATTHCQATPKIFSRILPHYRTVTLSFASHYGRWGLFALRFRNNV